MTEKTDTAVSKVENQTPATQTGTEETKARQVRVMRPVADIHETRDGAAIVIDLPGVSHDSLDIDVDQNVLTVKGEIELDTPEDLTPTYMDVSAGAYQRQFTLSAELDSSKIEAKLKDGVLRLDIPRSEKHKPRKIEVKAA